MKTYEKKDISFIEIMRRNKQSKFIWFSELQVRGEIRQRADRIERFNSVRRVNCHTRHGTYI